MQYLEEKRLSFEEDFQMIEMCTSARMSESTMYLTFHWQMADQMHQDIEEFESSISYWLVYPDAIVPK